MNAKERNTKEKILSVAHDLFARKGFDGVSIRDICKEADVNVSSVNYHFENKLGLYVKILEWAIEKMRNNMEELAGGVDSLEAYISKMFDHFIDNRNEFIATFKFLKYMADVVKDIHLDSMDNDEGPPGGENIRRFVLKEAPNASEEDQAWIERVVFSIVYHKALIVCNDCITEHKAKYGITPDTFKKDIIRTANLMLSSLQK
jgi:AcrR family transcriptional regulator